MRVRGDYPILYASLSGFLHAPLPFFFIQLHYSNFSKVLTQLRNTYAYLVDYICFCVGYLFLSISLIYSKNKNPCLRLPTAGHALYGFRNLVSQSLTIESQRSPFLRLTLYASIVKLRPQRSHCTCEKGTAAIRNEGWRQASYFCFC